MKANVKFAKVRPDAIIPSKRAEDMGFDIYPCFEDDYLAIYPCQTKLIPTGIASSCDPEYGFVLRERGSTGSKGMALRAGVIDSGYRSEWFVGLTNTTDKILFISKLSEQATYTRHFGEIFMEPSIVYPYSKAIAQALVLPVPEVEAEELTYEELQAIPSERGLGKLGSSKK